MRCSVNLSIFKTFPICYASVTLSLKLLRPRYSMDKNLALEIFLKKSELRKEVWSKLNKPKTATEIAKELGKHRSAISRVLLDLQKANFIECVNPEESSFRHYQKR